MDTENINLSADNETLNDNKKNDKLKKAGLFAGAAAAGVAGTMAAQAFTGNEPSHSYTGNNTDSLKDANNVTSAATVVSKEAPRSETEQPQEVADDSIAEAEVSTDFDPNDIIIEEIEELPIEDNIATTTKAEPASAPEPVTTSVKAEYIESATEPPIDIEGLQPEITPEVGPTANNNYGSEPQTSETPHKQVTIELPEEPEIEVTIYGGPGGWEDIDPEPEELLSDLDDDLLSSSGDDMVL